MKNPPSSISYPASRFPKKSGFTLVEVLTVIAIISILMTAGAIGLGNLTAGKGTSSAIATCESLFDEARTIAVSKRCSSRVLVDIDNKGNENYLRRIVIAHQKINDDGSVDPNAWIISGRGYTMPQGTFFSRIYSTKENGTAVEESSMSMTNEAGKTMTNYAGKYAIYEFNSEGIFNDAGSSFVVGSGRRPKNGDPKTVAGAKRDFAGFVIWRNGSTSTYRSLDQIDNPKLPAGDSNFDF